MVSQQRKDEVDTLAECIEGKDGDIDADPFAFTFLDRFLDCVQQLVLSVSFKLQLDASAYQVPLHELEDQDAAQEEDQEAVKGQFYELFPGTLFVYQQHDISAIVGTHHNQEAYYAVVWQHSQLVDRVVWLVVDVPGQPERNLEQASRDHESSHIVIQDLCAVQMRVKD